MSVDCFGFFFPFVNTLNDVMDKIIYCCLQKPRLFKKIIEFVIFIFSRIIRKKERKRNEIYNWLKKISSVML